MTQPTDTPNPATSTRPERSSKKVAHKKPLAWLPLALLALLALLVFLLIRGAKNNNNNASATPSVAPSASAPTASTGGTGAAGGFTATAGALPGALIGGANLAPIPATNVGTAAAGLATGTPAAGGEAATAAKNSAPGTAGTVLFSSADPTPDANGQKVIQAAAQQLKASGATTVEVRGYTDIVAGATTNDPLSMQRADHVAAALRTLLPGVTVTSVAKGEGDPVATNDTEAGRQQNRRVVIAATG